MAATLVGGAALGLLLARALGGLVAVLLVATATHSALSQLGLRSRFLPLIATLVMWLGLEALIWHPPAGWYALEWANRGLLLPAEALLQRRLELGPSASGAYCVALFGLYGLSAHLAASRRDRRRLGRYLLALWVAQCAYVALLLSVADGSLGSLAMRASRLLNLDTGQFALFGLLSLVAGAHWAAVELATLPAGACGRPVGARWTAWGLLTLATLALCAPPRETAGAATVGFLVQGQDWDKGVYRSPQDGVYGKDGGGMYGELPKYVQRMGFSPRFVPSPLKWPDISGLRVLVLVMPLPQRPLARPECEAVWKHVRLGGSLLVVGDHTGGSGFARGMNELLAPTGMRLNSDASWPRAAHWWGQLDLAPHGAAAGGGRLASADGTGVNVGGTISTRWPATPVLVGKAGWADEGDPTNAAEGCLGNSVREEGERVGDLVLCSATRFGLGKVMLFGDSSSFQNSALSNSYGFVCDVLYWLSSRRVHSAWRGNALIAILLVAAAWWSMRRTAATPLWVCAVGVSICVAQAACLAGRAPVTPPPARGGPPIALIDTSHLNMLSGATVQGDAYWGLLHCLMRDGFLPLMARTFDAEELAQGAVLVVPAPLATFSPDDVRRCLDWVRKGGRLVLTVGHEQVGAALPLLRRLGVSVDPTPMGRTEASWGREEVQFYEAWPVRADQPGARVLLSDGDTPLALERRVGKGTALVIGDSFFLLDKNLEGLDKWYLGNIHFLRSWLQRPDEGGGKT